MKSIEEQVIMVTGATDGLGRAVAMELARRGAELLLHGRSEERGKHTIREIKARHPNVRVRFYRADLASLAEVRELGQQVLRDNDRLDVLINNAGVYLDERHVSADGIELAFQVNYLSHVLLTDLLLPLLHAAAPSRIVNVASAGQSEIDFDDLMLERAYSGGTSYQRSKLAQIIYTFDLAERHAAEGITVNTLHPSTFMPTKMVVGRFPPSSSVDDGVAATVRLAVAPELDGVTGKYFNVQREAQAHRQAYDPEAHRRLAELTDRLLSAAQ